MNFGVCDFSRFEVTDWRLRRWRLWFLALMTATRIPFILSELRHKGGPIFKGNKHNSTFHPVSKVMY